jgi:hypothetical protein
MDLNSGWGSGRLACIEEHGSGLIALLGIALHCIFLKFGL